ncbi:MAG: hypothetical protein FWD57_09810 [Polyangiaceae bacterium]|nr:hypothetical protein [Polyangiaceae bacterium]
MITRVTLTIAAAAVALSAFGCATKYVEFPVWEGEGQEASTAKKMIPHCAGTGGCPKTYDRLQADDVDGAIALLEGDENKSAMVWAYLAVLYEVKHDWDKAEAAINEAIKTDSSYQSELDYIQDHKRKFVRK